MFDKCRRRLLGRVADVATVVTFLGLASFAYGQIVLDVGRVLTAPSGSAFGAVYQPGQNLGPTP